MHDDISVTSRLLFGEKVYFLYHNSPCRLSMIPPKAQQTRPSMASTSTKPGCFEKMIGGWKLRQKPMTSRAFW